jgi:hypothetical protein
MKWINILFMNYRYQIKVDDFNMFVTPHTIRIHAVHKIFPGIWLNWNSRIRNWRGQFVREAGSASLLVCLYKSVQQTTKLNEVKWSEGYKHW